MLFDEVARLVAVHQGKFPVEVCREVRECAVFDMGDYVPRHVGSWEPEGPSHPLSVEFLPFPSTCVEYDVAGDTRSLAIFSEAADDDGTVVPPTDAIFYVFPYVIGGAVGVICHGVCRVNPDAGPDYRRVELAKNVSRVLIREDGSAVCPDPFTGEELDAEENRSFLAMLSFSLEFALRCVARINEPTRFVVERAPLREPRRRANKNGTPYTPPSDERPVYTTLTLGQIRRDLGLAANAEDGRGRRAHYRRAHLRTFRSRRFRPEVRGTSRVIPAHWVGPSETKKEGKRYKVRVDL